jgi:hypothetical protein
VKGKKHWTNGKMKKKIQKKRDEFRVRGKGEREG